ncbi:hypothetical protein LIA77_00042 [Sarocladium implicatum]|nr:hypothetical protein LIA77_00042 [Sarocladium implicatum]
MVSFSLISASAAILLLTVGASAAPRARSNETTAVHVMELKPNYPYDPNTISTCTYWWDNNGEIPCADMPGEWGISMEAFLRWNPSITSTCGNFLLERSYCVEARDDPVEPPTTTKPPSGIATPTPTQGGMVNNCNKFHFVKQGQACSTVLSEAQISLAQLFEWNSSVNKDCSGLWAEVYVCVGVVGQATTTSAAPPSTTTAGNGIATPTPIQEGMVGNCNKFYFVKDGQTCSSVLAESGLSLAQLYRWNPTVKSDCSGLWSKVYVCISTTDPITTTTTTKPTTTAPGNGISTPSPVQSGMVGNCNKFHWVSPGDSCQQIVSYQGISLAEFVKWNTGFGSNCNNMQASNWACVGIVGGPTTTTTVPTTTTKAGNGVATPTPTQPGMVNNCNKFHYISTGDTCQQIVSYQGITIADFVKWNSGFGSNCNDMWAEAWACVGVL